MLAAPAVERRKLATLVFCDVAGSTALGHNTDPEAVRGLMLSYFADAREVLEHHGGTVEKFIGDAVVAAFATGGADEPEDRRERSTVATFLHEWPRRLYSRLELVKRTGAALHAMECRDGVGES